MEHAITLAGPGGPEMLQQVPWAAGQPGPGEVLIRHEAIGVNFIDIYHRSGLYPLAQPGIPGVEGAGVVEAVGPDVQGLSVGQRITYAGLPGAYASVRLLPAWRAMPLPDAVPAERAAAVLLRGLTAHMLLTRTYPVGPGSIVLVHAAAGGLGTILTRWVKHLGGIVIGTAGSDAKAEAARRHGADHMIVGRSADVAAAVAALTEGRGCDFAVDGIGGEMLAQTLRCVRRFGTVASIGQAAGSIPPLAVEELGPVRALTLARHSVMAYAAERDTYPEAVQNVLAMMALGVVAGDRTSYPLVAAAQAHADLEAGRTTGSIVLRP